MDRVPDELWTEVRDIVPSPRKRNAKKQNGCLGEALQIAVKRREVKSKGERKDLSI